EDALAIARQIGDRWDEAMVLVDMADRWYNIGQLDEAQGSYRAASSRLEELGMESDAAFVAVWLAATERRRGDAPAAGACLERCLARIRTNTWRLLCWLEQVALLAASRGRIREAAVLIGAVDSHGPREGSRETLIDDGDMEDEIACIRSSLSEG